MILLEWDELQRESTSPELLAKLEAAYGYDGLGILAVRGIPGYVETRAAALPQAFKFGHLPEDVKAKFVDEKSFYSFGWSHGKEKLEGRHDTSKGSYYANPVHDAPFSDPSVIAAHPSFASPNVWPSDADAPGFEAAYKAMARLIVDAGAQLARHVDAYARSIEPSSYPPGPGLGLRDIVLNCRTHKARLLYYFPLSAEEAAAVASAAASSNSSSTGHGGSGGGGGSVDVTSSWCGWHNDHGSLTGLTAAMYFDAAGNPIPCPDPDAGLFIRSRGGQLVQVSMPPDALAFQIGETAQVHSGGILQATPHCVRAALKDSAGVSRGTMAVFMEPEWPHAMTCPGLKPGDSIKATLQQSASEAAAAAAAADSAPPSSPTSEAAWQRVLKGARGELLPRGVPALASRWTGPDQSFGQFTDATLAAYY